MINPPTTLTEARAHRYGQIFENRYRGYPYFSEYCAYEVKSMIKGYPKLQCSRANGHGIAGLYCKQHAGIVERLLREREENK